MAQEQTSNPSGKTTNPSATSGSLARKSRLIPLAVVLALTLLSGIVHGIIDGRWTEPKDLVAKAELLDNIPEKLGEWQLVEKRPLNEDAAEMLRCYGSIVRVYRHPKNEVEVTVAILYGPRGPIAVHTPEVCYDSVGTDQIGKRKSKTIRHGSSKDSFWSVKFAKAPETEIASMDVWYGWNAGGGWVASKYPRFWMVDSLYKLQIAGPVGVPSFRPCEDFLTEFLPHANKLVNSP